MARYGLGFGLHRKVAPLRNLPTDLHDLLQELPKGTGGSSVHSLLPALADGSSPHDRVAAAEQSDLHNAQANHRAIGFAFASTLPFPDAIVRRMRLVVEPLRLLMKMKLDVSAKDYEQKRRGLEREAEEALRDERPLSDRGFYIILTATCNEHELKANKQLSQLMFSDTTTCLFSEDALAEDFPVGYFLQSGLIAALIEELLVAPHERYPLKAFGALLSPELAAEVHGDPSCVKGWHFSDFCRRVDVRTMVGQAKLRLRAQLTRNETALLECLHAEFRRLLKASRLQTHEPDIEFIFARWLCRLAQKDLTLGGHDMEMPPLVDDPTPLPSEIGYGV